MKCCFTLFTALLCTNITFAQVQLAPKKTLEAKRITEKLKINGDLSESVWANAPVATDFVFQWPTPGKTASQKTVVKILYDDASLYIGAYCYDTHPDSIFHRLSKRDELENTDAFSIIIDAYRDGQNAVQFGITPDNVQFDSKYSLANANSDNGNSDGEDPNWDAVWRSAAQITPDGWVAEFEIPYSALRFPKKKIQDWSINLNRSIRRHNESDCWNEVKAEINGSLSQMGILQGITDIKAPLRLSATPFVATYANNVYNLPSTPHSGWAYPYTIGMDVKYGINEAFTLDATVIPDFGQVRTDNFVLNLSPFEVRFNENRPFFTEGTELFNKGNLFYSRRVGAGVPLLNATKVSGRTQKGLGIGLFNAIEDASFETIIEEGNETRNKVSPLTNKSILVFDQNLRNNSSITLINTNVMRSGAATDANVTGLLLNLKNKSQSYAMSGKLVYSTRQRPDRAENGFSSSLDVSKTSGNFQWGTNMNIESDEYNPNDLGLLFSPNELTHVAWVNYSRYKPWWKLNNFWTSAWTYSGGLYKPFAEWTETSFGFNFGGNTTTFHNFGINSNFSPWGERDYFEPRTQGFEYFYRLPASGRVSGWYNSDNRKRIVYYASSALRLVDEHQRRSTNIEAGIRWRASSKLSLGVGVSQTISKNNVGGLWSFEIDENALGYELGQTIILGRRDLKGFENTINANYAITNRMNIALYSRHYWQKANYKKFYTLDENGQLLPTKYSGKKASGESIHDVVANYFNIDLVYTWRFAPGSDLLLVYKNFIGDETYGSFQTTEGYGYNAKHLLDFTGSNSISLKVLYFIDYEQIKKKLDSK